ncbi:anti-sigma regulatory factor [Oscillatoriales cyanobacterium USR001]|nr:anti-sigma regulatory factor [Oscillatoriales cyanobacterium USR001]
MSININEIPEGGRGLKLMWQLADELSYIRTDGSRNCLVIRKNYEQSPGAPPKSEKGNVLEMLMECFYHWKWFKECDRKLGTTPPIKKIRLQVKSDLSALTEVLQWYDRLSHLPIPKLVWWKCQLALAEGFTNAVRHAHRGMPLETPIQLEVRVFKEQLEIKIWDYGQPFDFDTKVKAIQEREEINCLESEGLISDGATILG